MLNDGEVDVAMFFDPAATAAGIAQGTLPETARVFVPKAGSIGNISFVAIPFNAAHTAGLTSAGSIRVKEVLLVISFSCK